MKFSAVTSVFLLVLVLALVGRLLLFVSSQAFAEVYQNTGYHYSIWYPSCWFVDGSGWSSIVSLEPKMDSWKCTLLIVGAAAQPPNATLEHSKEIWTSRALVFEPVKNVTNMTFHGIPAYKIVYASDPLKHKMTKIVTVKNGIEYSLDFDAYDPQLPVIQKVIDTFRITSSSG
jgi:hypothetical protein